MHSRISQQLCALQLAVQFSVCCAGRGDRPALSVEVEWETAQMPELSTATWDLGI